MGKKYRTVNGIKTKPVDEKLRQEIRRAGNLEEQMRKAADYNVLDEDYYNKIARILKYISRDII